jgi:hypothetical protein
MVPEIMTGTRIPAAAKCASMAKSAALAFSVSKIGPTIEQATDRFRVGIDQIVEAHVPEAGIVDIR